MKKFLILSFLLLPGFSWGQKQATDYAQDHESKESILSALYDVISGAKGEARDWDRFRALFAENARLMPTGKDTSGTALVRVWSPNEYVEVVGPQLLSMGFYESEIHRVVEEYGPVAHVFSTYESRRTPEEKPFMRGVNSIQLFNDGSRWWIISIFWSGETENNPLPARYGG